MLGSQAREDTCSDKTRECRCSNVTGVEECKSERDFIFLIENGKEIQRARIVLETKLAYKDLHKQERHTDASAKPMENRTTSK